MSDPQSNPPAKEPLAIAGYPLSLWAIATSGFIVLLALLIFLLFRLKDEPLEFELPPEPPAATAPY